MKSCTKLMISDLNCRVVKKGQASLCCSCSLGLDLTLEDASEQYISFVP